MAIKDEELSKSVFPSDFVNPSVKTTEEYGLAYAKAIWGQYYSNWNIWNERKNRWIMSRKYAEGLQSASKYMGRFDVSSGASYLNLDFTPIPIIPKYVDNIVGKFTNQIYKILCEVIDPSSRTAEDEAQRKMKTNMFLKGYNEEVTSTTGIPLIPENEYVPDSTEEMDVYFQLHYKPALAMAMELALEFVFSNNSFEEIKEKVIRDFVNLKIGAIRKYYDESFKICVENIDPVDLIVPYSKYDDFRNIPYCAVIKKYTIAQIAKQQKQFTEEQLYDIAKSYAGKLQNPVWGSGWGYGPSPDGYYPGSTWAGRPYDNFNINVLEFEFLSVDTQKYEEKRTEAGSMYFDKKGYDYKPTSGGKAKKEVMSKDVQNRYEGSWIIGSKYLYGYKKSANVPREKIAGGYNPKTCLSIRIYAPNIYDMENKSLTERMIPHADQMTLISLKMQQFLMKAAPPGVWLDEDAAANVQAAMGAGVNKPLELIKMYQQTGSMVGSRKYDDDSTMNGKAIEILPNGMGDINGLILAYNAEIQKLNDIIGYNSATDGSSPPVEALVGTQKLAVQSTNNTLRPLNNAYVRLIRMVAKDVSLMIQDKFEYGDGLEGFERAIGRTAIDIIEIGKKIPLCEFGINIEFLPDEVERAEVDQYVQLALTSVPPQIDLADAVLVRQILKNNVKLATQMLVVRKKKYQEERMKEGMMQSQMNAEQQAMAAQATAEAEVQKEAQIMQMAQQQKMFEWTIEKEKLAVMHQYKLEEIAKQNEGKVDAAKTQNDGKLMTAALTTTTQPETATATA